MSNQHKRIQINCAVCLAACSLLVALRILYATSTKISKYTQNQLRFIYLSF